MKVIRLIFTLLLAAVAAGPALAQVDPAELGRIDDGIAVLEATQKRVSAELGALEKALAASDTVVWPTGEGWASASADQLTTEVAFVQLAANRPESRDYTARIAGLSLPDSLLGAAMNNPNRPARRVVREWADGMGEASKKEVATYHQNLKRTVKMTESWLAEHRSARQAATRPVAGNVAYPQGPCYVPPGNWQMGDTREVLDVKTNDYLVTATKTRGSRQVPAGKINFYVHPRTCDAGLQNAEDGFVNPFWVRARVQVEWIEPGQQFAIQWPERDRIVYTRVD